jgi:hypothetical protein
MYPIEPKASKVYEILSPMHWVLSVSILHKGTSPEQMMA